MCGRAQATPSRVLVIGVLTVTGLLGVAEFAAASRAPTPTERQAIAGAVGWPEGCIRVRISQKAPRLWARVTANNSRNCPAGDGVIVLQQTPTFGWRVRYQGPNDPTATRCPIRPIPTSVGVDLNLCLAPSRRVFAIDLGRLLFRPRTLTYGAHAALIRLRWRNWGRPRATARGLLDYGDRYTRFRLPVRVTLSRIGFCEVNRRTYRRQTVTAVRRRDRPRLHYLTGTTRLMCPRGY